MNRLQPTCAIFASQTTAKINALRIRVGVVTRTFRKEDGERWTAEPTAAPLVASSH